MTQFVRGKILALGTASVVSGLTLMADGALAQSSLQNTPLSQVTVPTNGSVPDRYSALGVRAGGFVVKPSLNLEAAYEDNILRTKTDTKSDIRTDVSAGVAVNSDWSRHAIGFAVGGTMGRYRDNPNENYDDAAGSVYGKLDIIRDTSATINAGRRRAHEERGSANDTAGREPIVYYVDTAETALNTKFNRLSATLAMALDDYHYAAQATATSENRKNDRDRLETRVRGRLGYEFSPGYTAFGQTTLNKRDYDQDRDRNGLQRSSKGYRVDGGVAFELTRLLIGEVFGGYFKQEYDEPSFKDPSGPAFGASLTWSATALTTVTGEVGRTVEESTTANTSGIVTTRYRLLATHELRENLAVNAALAYTTENYEGGSSRSDETFGGGVGARYYLSRMVNVGLSASQFTKESSVDSDGYRDRVVILSLGLTR